MTEGRHDARSRRRSGAAGSRRALARRLWRVPGRMLGVATFAGLLLAGCAGAAPPAHAPAPATLENTYWRLVAVGGRPVTVSDAHREPHLVLHGNGRLTGSGGCNRLTGGYRVDGQRLDFGMVAATRMMCAAGIEQETAFVSRLAGAPRWRIDGDRLILSDDRGDAALEFQAHVMR